MASRTNWMVWGLVVAEALPADVLDLGPNIRIEPMSPERRASVTRDAARLKPIEPDAPNYFSSVSGYREVRSDWSLWFRVTAKSADDAVEHVRRDLLPSVLVSLGRDARLPARAELIRVSPIRDDGYLPEPQSMWSGGMFAAYDCTERPVAVFEEAVAVQRVLASSAVGKDASARYLQTLEALEASSLTPYEVSQALLGFFLVIERIATAVVPLATAGPEVDGLLVELRNHLRERLNRDLAVSTHVREIRKAQADLGRIEGRFLGPRIAACAERLGVADEHRDLALEISRLRNSRLTHPGVLPGEEVHALHEGAERAARAFLTAYAARAKP